MPTAQAEAQFNAYRAALEEKKWSEALAAIKKAPRLVRSFFKAPSVAYIIDW